MSMERTRNNLIVVAGVSAIAMVSSQAASESIVDRFHRTYQTLQSVRCTFALNGVHAGQLMAVRGKGYILTLPDRQIISNGITVWNVTPSTKTVIINAVQHNGEDLSLERLFFSLLSVYRASSVKGASNELELLPPSPSVRIAGVTSARVTVDTKMRVSKVVVADGSSTSVWTLSNVRLNVPSGPTERFTFDSPAGWTTIDLR
jgi:outer membrane lipoprotein-sorting protein